MRTGDTFPTATPWEQSGGPYADRFALRLWEGVLTQGEDVLVITPSLFEWDGGGSAVASWINWAAAATKEFGARVTQLFSLGATGKMVIDSVQLGLDIAVSLDMNNVIGRKGDRPIGMVKENGQAVFKPSALVLTYDSVNALLANNEQPAGKGVGVFEFNFEDDPQYRGNYSMYLQVQAA